MSMAARTSLPLVLALCAALPAQAEVRTPPAPHCLDARTVSEVFQSDARTLAMVQADGRRFRVDLATDCPEIAADTRTRMLAAEGWMCGTGNEYMAVGTQLCPVAAPLAVARRSPTPLRPCGRPAEEREPCSPLAWPGSAADFPADFLAADFPAVAAVAAVDR